MEIQLIPNKIINGNDAWQQLKDKFCTPLNIGTVNNKWWIWNQVKECTKYGTNEYIGTKPEMNIKAKTKNFGYFGWNIDIECFYAVRIEKCDDAKACCSDQDASTNSGNTKKDENDSNTTTGVNNYEFRVIDTDNMFPGREPGFNYTDAAKATVSGETVTPSTLIDNIKLRKDEIFDDKANNPYRDYYFVLTKEKLQFIKDYTRTEKEGNYTEFKGDFTVDDNRSVYTSPLVGKLNGEVNTSTRFKVYGHK